MSGGVWSSTSRLRTSEDAPRIHGTRETLNAILFYVFYSVSRKG